jgi:8-oxo-dGTP pyrophosphatase MutT (NUDIX family)
LGGFQIPGGTVDYANGENIRQAIVREVEEETGLLIPDPEFLCMMNSFCYGPDKPLHIAFVGKSETEIVPINPEPHKAEDWEWMPLDTVSDDAWFRMSRIAVDFYLKLKSQSDLSRFVIDEDFASA